MGISNETLIKQTRRIIKNSRGRVDVYIPKGGVLLLCDRLEAAEKRIEELKNELEAKS